MSVRVAYLVTRYPKLSETFIEDEMAALERQGVEIDLYALRAGSYEPRRPADPPARGVSVLELAGLGWIRDQGYWLLHSPVRWLGIWLHCLASHAGSPRSLAQACLAVIAGSSFGLRLRAKGTDHLHAHWATHSALTAWVIHRLTGLPYSFTAHADDLFVRRPMLEEKVRDAAFVVTISEFNRRFLAEQLGDWILKRLRVIRCGVALDAFTPEPNPGHRDPFTILCVARLEEKKGHRVLLKACRRLADEGLAFRCWIVGEGRERRSLERLSDELGLASHVAFLGAQPRDRVRERLARADVVALPCVVAANGRADGIPVALMEAMAMARPVVSTTTSGIPELVVHEESGLLTDPGDAVALSRALLRVATDPALASALGAAGRRAVKAEFDLEHNVAVLRSLFLDALGPGREGLAGRMDRGPAPGEALG